MKKTFCLFLFYWLGSVTLFAQDHALDTLIKRFDNYRQNNFQEKIYAHLDRNFYLTGETLWFKIYTVDGSFHKPVSLSKVAYVEILDKSDFPVLQAKVELKNGTGHGSFYLPASLNSANYKFRVYTSWMKNFSAGYYFHQAFTILNPFITPEPKPASIAKRYNVDFFPEGGDLVSGIRSKVGFKITDETGKGAYGTGSVINSAGDTVVSFTPEKFGIGSFLFTPSATETYRVILSGAGNAGASYTLPKVYPAGYTLQLRDSGEFVRVSILSSGVVDNNVYLFVHARQITALAERQMLNRGMTSFIVKKNSLPDGISHFTLFNDKLQPVCERLYFTWPRKALDIALETNQKVYKTRKRVSLSFQTNTSSGEPIAADLSVSVYKLDSLSTQNPAGIFPYLWLGSDLRGAIESPAYYFSNADRQVARAMDNLMLTHGWRRFEWADVLEKKDSRFSFLPEARGHIITGIVTKNQVPQSSVFTYLGSPGRIIRAYGSWSNASGEIRFEIKDFYGPRRIIVQTQHDSTQTHEVKIVNPFSHSMDDQKLAPFTIDDKFRDALVSRSIAMQVQDIYYYEQYANRITEPVIDSSAFYGKADATYYLDDYTRFPIMEEVMREYVPTVFVRKRRDGFHFLVVDQVYGGILSGSPIVLLDGVPILDVDDIMAIDPLRIKKLEVVNRQYFLGQSVFSGIVSYTTYNGDLGGMAFDPKTLSLNYDGLQLKREFYSPKYNSPESADRLPDQRYLLYWQPEVSTDDQGRQNVEFYTSDVEGDYLMVVEGISKDGHAGSRHHTISVKPGDNP